MAAAWVKPVAVKVHKHVSMKVTPVITPSEMFLFLLMQSE
jgi:hypothetical protein